MKLPLWLRMERAARRQIALDLQLPKEHAKVWKTHKKDKSSRKQVPNTVRKEDHE